MERNTIRQLPGLNQLKFAYLLGISESLIAMYETGQRELPTKALLAFGKLQAAFEQMKSGIEPLDTSKPLKTIKSKLEEKGHGRFHVNALEANLKRKLKTVNLEIQKMEMYTEKLRENLDAVWKSIQVVEHLLANQSADLDVKVLDLALKTRLTTIDKLAEKWVLLNMKLKILKTEQASLEETIAYLKV